MTTTRNTKQRINAVHMQYVEPMKMLSESGENTMSAVWSVRLCQERIRLSVLPELTQPTHILSSHTSFVLVSLTTRPLVTINICYPVPFIAWRREMKKERIRKDHPQADSLKPFQSWKVTLGILTRQNKNTCYFKHIYYTLNWIEWIQKTDKKGVTQT